MSEWREAFIASVAAIPQAPKTVTAYNTAVRRFEAFLAEWGKDLKDIPKQALSEFAVYLSKSGLKPASIHLYVSGTVRFLDWCRDNGLNIPPMPKPKMPRIRDPIPIVMKEKSLAAYVQVAQSVKEPYKTALLLLPATGLRGKEMCTLRLEDVIIEPPWVRFNVGGVGGTGENTKSSRDRIVPMLKTAKPILGRYLRDIRPRLRGDKWLFPNMVGNHIQPRELQKQMRYIRGKLGIAHLTPHVMRHTYLTILNESGITGFDLAEIAGHKNLHTSRLYVHPSATELSKKVHAIDTDWMNDS